MCAQEQAEHATSEILVDYFDHRLSAQQEAEIERHLANCDACTALARRIRQISDSLEDWAAAMRAKASALKAKSKQSKI